MAFKFTVEDIKKGQKCPPGMVVMSLKEVKDPYFNEKGTEVQEVLFETTKGYSIRYWFHGSDMGKSSMAEFVEAADKVKFDLDTMSATGFDPKDYLGKPVAASISHQKDKNGKPQVQVDAFYNSDKAPF